MESLISVGMEAFDCVNESCAAITRQMRRLLSADAMILGYCNGILVAATMRRAFCVETGNEEAAATHSLVLRTRRQVKLFSADETALILSAWERRNYQSWETLFLLSSALHYPNKRVSLAMG
jgi:hypothetical protein